MNITARQNRPSEYELFAQAGTPAIELWYNSVLGYSLNQEAPATDYPVEPDSFGAFSKVVAPAQLTVSVAVNKEHAQKTAKDIIAMMRTTALYVFASPEWAYRNLNIVGLRQEKQGATQQTCILILTLKEIKDASTLDDSNITASQTKHTSMISTVNVGTSNTFDYDGVDLIRAADSFKAQ